ncbi:Nif3-like dinuclear metal center hexameric protein [Cellulosilyticum sp. ST5]|uniref:Nif3-like dinuclear metal center hexameric protein n=1 Tax=unclassified Cellulosilyticum TaxID=2643091 RepID=UPI000F8CDD60|nr:Nif3-like dinuclear metal center hexameric protein [Cellulosilyticum sp. WCF-2]QEH69522.1 Nif3-like dinuclear metal center hexameric protein [Cellulosilyticum sp. WCF-2]
MPILKEIIITLEKLAPIELAESWDAVGLMLGSGQQEISKVLCALDLNEEVVEEAIQIQADCIITHHPFFFKPLKSVDLDSKTGKIIAKLIKANIAVYAMHTNYDIAEGGLNDYLCAGLGLKEVEVLQMTKQEKLCKCQVYVPITHAERVREVIVNYNQCKIGDYLGCTFMANGEGTFIPLEEAHPYIGTSGSLEKVQECVISFMVEASEVSNLMEHIQEIHPYEEVAFDVFELKHITKEYGIGRVGVLPQTLSLEAFITNIKQFFNLSYVRVTKVKEEPVIKRVAICSGSGSEYISVAARKADVYITGDLKFHEAQMAYHLGIPVIDVGHYASENNALKPIGDCIMKQFPKCEVVYSKVDGEMLFIR